MLKETNRFSNSFKHKRFSIIDGRSERYCFKCHKTQAIGLFDKPSVAFRYASICHNCFEKQKRK